MERACFWLVVGFIMGFTLGWVVGDKEWGEKGDLRGRIILLERKLERKTQPIIQINRASVYPTEGDIVIEGIKY